MVQKNAMFVKGGDYQLKLTEKQKRFADNYIESGNATESYKRAGYAGKGNTAEVSACQIIRNPKVKNYIEKRLQQIEDAKIADLTEVLQRITEIARGKKMEQKEVINPVTGQKEVTKNPSPVATQLRALEDMLKRFPQSDELMALQIRKLKAEAEISELKARMLKDNGADVEQVLDAVIDKISGVDSNGSE